MKKRGQGAMEFLMTYGWAIVVVIVVLSALYFLGVFSPKTVSRCDIEAPFVCNDFVATDIGVTFSVGGKNIKNAQVTDIIINGQSCGALDGDIINRDLFPDSITQVSCSGIQLSEKQKISAEIVIDYTKKLGDLAHTIVGSSSGVAEFAASHPPTIQLISPSDDATDLTIPVTLQWDGNDLDGNELTYNVYLDENLIGSCNDLTEKSCQLDEEDIWYGTIYQWHVNVSDRENQVQSPTRRFTTQNGLPADGLAFGWNGRTKNDYVGGLSGTLLGGLLAGNIQTGFFDNNATLFDGGDGEAQDDKILTGLTSNNYFQNGFTISAWIYPESRGETWGYIVDKSTSTSAGNGFRYSLGANDGSNFKISFQINGGTVRTSNSYIPYNNWYHIVVTVSSDGTVTHYINGNSAGSGATNPVSQITTSNPMAIGNYAVSTSRTFDGTIDEVHIWNRVFNAGEIADLYDFYT